MELNIDDIDAINTLNEALDCYGAEHDGVTPETVRAQALLDRLLAACPVRAEEKS